MNSRGGVVGGPLEGHMDVSTTSANCVRVMSSEPGGSGVVSVRGFPQV